MPKPSQMLNHPVQQFATDSEILEVREQCKDHNLSGFTRAEAVADDSSIDGANVTRQYARTGVVAPGFRCNAEGSKSFFRHRVFACSCS